ncbi:zinc-dependent metalloprotease [Hymenobacter weizhouensis]|uniref:zinc-dependent metalloprotease n=1 Tax=Hymenobacter sp. YIM 151500-1 TaxID=2987689 RepID=UPI00222729EC|nr:zinc-dependent metalloprotease [Hymenobacter sp. YIM 151500-1]UYZ64720.1 zinc-dependent metalloprotease [Hymenobacter sp. YIM 151500-1]
MKTNFPALSRNLSFALLAGLSLAACENTEPRPAASATAPASADARLSRPVRPQRNSFVPGHYRAESVLKNEPTQIVLGLTTKANTPDVTQALESAMQQYNSLNLNITFVRQGAASGAGQQYFVTIDDQNAPVISNSGISFSNYSADATTGDFISASQFPFQINGNPDNVEPGRTLQVNTTYALAKGGSYLINLFLKELGHVLGVENTDIRGSRIRGTDMIDVNYTANGIRYQKNQLNGTPVLVPETRSTTADPTSVFTVGGSTYSPAPASLNAKDQLVLRLLFGK